jgi:serine/threonine-protein kinase HipA
MTITIAVYADWDRLPAPLRLGFLHAHPGTEREIVDFAFDAAVLDHPALRNLHLDPRIGPFGGRQYPPKGNASFGVFDDASPDRWGRMLMRRRLERDQRAGRKGMAVRLHNSDFLLGVHDVYRVGALRFKRDDDGEFLDDRHDVAAPPFVRLRELEAASLALERDVDNTASAADDWLRMLIAPGGSLGGARPKASIVDPDNHLWIAKFPSANDVHDVGAWELIVHTLARRCGLRVPPSMARCYASAYHTFIVKRFDRTPTGRRLHFASAMTLTGRTDGDDAASGASYLDIARVLMDHGAQTNADLLELWTRIVFSVLVSNADDHLRNHGFIHVPGKGWRLSEAYDMNPVPGSHGLKLNISESDNAMDLALVRSVAPHFRVKARHADEIIGHFRSIVRQWPTIARALEVSDHEQGRMAAAFRLATSPR